jgi:hypothetical protein
MGVTPSVRQEPVAEVEIVFSEPVTGFDLGDLRLLGPSGSAPTQFTLLDWPLEAHLVPHGISADGSVIAGDDVQSQRAFRWTKAGGLEYLTEGYGTVADISDDGQTIVGNARDSEGKYQSFLWRQGIAEPIFRSTPEMFVAADGSAVAFDFAAGAVSILWTPNEAPQAIGSGTPDYLRARAVSNDGTLVVGLSDQTARARTWRPGGETAPIPGVPLTVSRSSADALTPDGRFVFGAYQMGLESTLFRWDMAGRKLVTLGVVSQIDARVVAASVDGEVAILQAGSTGYVWDALHGVRSMPDILASGGVDPSAWSSFAVEEVSEIGRSVIGKAYAISPAPGQEWRYFRIDYDRGTDWLSSGQSLEQVDARTWRLMGLAAANQDEGKYQLAFQFDHDVRGENGEFAIARESEIWSIDRTPPQATIERSAANSVDAPFREFTVRFDEPVSGVELTDFRLSVAGGPNLIGSTVQLVADEGGTQWRIQGLDSAAVASGHYLLELVPSGAGIADLAGNSLARSAAAEFEVLPTVRIEAGDALRTSALSEATITFNEPIEGLDLADLLLTRNGVAIPLVGKAALASADGRQWRLQNITRATSGPGRYELSLRMDGSQIRNSAGTPLSAAFGDKWFAGHNWIGDPRIEFVFGSSDSQSIVPEIIDGRLSRGYYGSAFDYGVGIDQVELSMQIEVRLPRPIDLLAFAWSASVAAGAGSIGGGGGSARLSVRSGSQILSETKGTVLSGPDGGSATVPLAVRTEMVDETHEVRNLLFAANGSARASGDMGSASAEANINDIAMILGAVDTSDGDFDGNGKTDLSDFGILRNHFGQSDLSGMNGDVTGDGLIDLSDFGRFKARFGGRSLG